MVKMLAAIPLIAGAWLISAWFTMLVVGVARADWISWLPTIGYRTALVIAMLTGTSILIRVSTITAIRQMLR